MALPEDNRAIIEGKELMFGDRMALGKGKKMKTDVRLQDDFEWM